MGLGFFNRWIINFSLARLLSASEFGYFSFLYSLANILAPLFSFGSNLYLIQKAKAGKVKAGRLTLYSFGYLIALLAVILIGWFVVRLLGVDFPYAEGVGLALVLASLWAGNTISFALFKGLGIFKIEAKTQAWGLLLFASFLALGWLLEYLPNSKDCLIALVVLQAMIFLIGLAAIVKQIGVVKAEIVEGITREEVKQFLKEKTPFGLHEWLSHLYTHAGFLLMGLLVVDHELAAYRSAYLLVIPVSILPGVFSQVLLQRFSPTKGISKEDRKLFRSFLAMIVLLSNVVFFAYFFGGATAANWFFGDKYPEGAFEMLMPIMALTFAIQFVSSIYGVLLTAAGKQKFRVKITFLAIWVNIGCTALFVSLLGVKGGAIAHLAAVTTILLACVGYAERKLLTS